MIRNLLFVLFLLKTSFFFSQNAKKVQWTAANGPNYAINQYLAYPYSNEDCSSSGTVTAIPARLSSYVHLVDFYGEGRIEDKGFVLGFKSAYNINLEYQLVSRGSDKDRRIPNRIPVRSMKGDLGLSRYIASNRVSTVTLMRKSALKLNTVQEMARIVRKDRFGKIIVYGFESTDPGILILEDALAKIGYSYTSDYVLEYPFNEIKGFPNAPRVYQSKKITATEETVFYSSNPKTDPGITQSDMLTLDYTSLLALDADLSGGIKGTIDKPGGKIEVEVFAYDHEERDGIQKFASTNASGRSNKTVYKIFTDVSSTENYIEKTVSIPFGFAKNIDGSYRTLGEAQSNNIKLLGASSSSGWVDSGCNWSIIRFTRWFTWTIKSLFYKNVPYECQDVVSKIRSGKHPVLLKVTLKDATLYNLKIPGVATTALKKFIKSHSEKLNRDSKKKLQEYKVIKNLKITVLEAPNQFQKANYYTDKIISQIKEANQYFTAKTGYVTNTQIAAEIGNPRILFNKASITIKKATRESYNLQTLNELEEMINAAALDNNDAETLQIVYVYSLKVNELNSDEHILGYTYSIGDVIEDSHFCSFSYNRLFTSDVNQIGTIGSTFTHELGHYFNLLHPFSGGCAQTNGGDGIADTPPCEGDQWSVQGSRLIANPCENAPRNCNGLRRQIENIMDYGPCRWLFTKGQANRITDRINTKPSLFTTLMAYDSAIDPDDVTVTISDLRHQERRKKRSLSENHLAIEMPASGSNSAYFNLSVTTNESGNAQIRIYDINSFVVYENNVSIAEGLNTFPIASNLFKPNTLYIVSCTNEYTSERIKFISRQY